MGDSQRWGASWDHGATGRSGQQPPGRSFRLKGPWWLWALGVFASLVVIGLLTDNSDDSPTPSPSVTVTETVTQTETATEAPTATETVTETPAVTETADEGAVPDEPTPSVPENVHYEDCDAARDAGAAPVYAGEPGYGPHLDRDGDGVACEPYLGR